MDTELWWSSWIPALRPYAVLLKLFTAGQMSADEFELIYLRMFAQDETDWPSELFGILDGLFADADSYCRDEILRSKVGGITAEQLLAAAGAAFDRLDDLAG